MLCCKTRSCALSGHSVVIQQEGGLDGTGPREGGEVRARRESCGGGARVQVQECLSEKILRQAV